MDELKEKSLNVFVEDRRGVPIPHAQVVAFYDGTKIGDGYTRGFGWSPVTLHFGPDYDHLTLEARYDGYSQTKTVSADARNFRFKFNEVTMPRTDIAIVAVGTLLFSAICFGIWFGVKHFAGNQGASWVFGGILLLFIMAVVWFKPTERFEGPQQQLIKIIGSIAVGLFAGFFTGSLRLGGKLPFANDIEIAAVGGFAAFVFSFMAWPKSDT